MFLLCVLCLVCDLGVHVWVFYCVVDQLVVVYGFACCDDVVVMR